MIWKPRSQRFAKSYSSNISIVDGQSLFLRENPQRDHIELLRNAARYRATALPQQLPAQQAEELEQSSQMVELAKAQLALPVEATKEKARLRTKRDKLRQQMLTRYQDSWAEEDYRRHVAGRDNLEIRGSQAVQDLKTAQADFLTLRPFMPERARIADIASGNVKCDRAVKQRTIEDLIKICSQDERVFYRPQEEPIEGRCPVCYQDINMWVVANLQSTLPNEIIGCNSKSGVLIYTNVAS